MTEPGIISADSHVVEPHDLWRDRVSAKFRDRAPLLIHEQDTDRLVCEGRDLAPVGLLAGCYRSDEETRIEGRWDEDVPAAGYDPRIRLGEIQKDGVDVEVLFPSVGMHMYPITDASLQWALFRAYNDWLSEFCAVAPQHFKGLGMLNHEDVDTAVAEIERCATLGMSGVMVPLWAGEDNAYYLPKFDRVWAAAVAHDFPVNMHTS
ncbi:MAG TPA: amidohydrolase family protein, partial [Acidimicrobiales bacterium]|nr:amidohydrolase family protein [Acidimicrobiales bacterium]